MSSSPKSQDQFNIYNPKQPKLSGATVFKCLNPAILEC